MRRTADLGHTVGLIRVRRPRLIKMQIRPTRVHVCFGTPPQHLQRLREIAASGEPDWWTINSEALPGDQIAFYNETAAHTVCRHRGSAITPLT